MSTDQGLRDILMQAAMPLIDRVVESADVTDVYTQRLRDLATASLAFVLAVPAGTLPEVLPPDIREQLEALAPLGVDIVPDTMAATVHEAFYFTTQFTTQRAEDAGIRRDALQNWLRVMAKFETLVADVLVGGIMAAQQAREHEARNAESALVAAFLQGRPPAIDAGQGRNTADGRPELLVQLPWLNQPDLRVTVVLIRSWDVGPSAEAGLPDLADLPRPSIGSLDTPESILVMPEHEVSGALPRIAEAFNRSDIVIGLPVDVTDTQQALSWCRRALFLMDTMTLGPTQSTGRSVVIHCADIVVPLLVGADPVLLRRTAYDLLRPFQGMRSHRRKILLETLLAWSRQPQAGIPTIAVELGRHPQTVRYRMRQLRSLLGPLLDDESHMLTVRITLSLIPDLDSTPITSDWDQSSEPIGTDGPPE